MKLRNFTYTICCPCRHTLQDECRVLLLHGVLHLLGQDHELGAAEADAMGAAEQAVMAALGWRGSGLIEAAGGGADGPHAPDGEVST